MSEVPPDSAWFRDASADPGPSAEKILEDGNAPAWVKRTFGHSLQFVRSVFCTYFVSREVLPGLPAQRNWRETVIGILKKIHPVEDWEILTAEQIKQRDDYERRMSEMEGQLSFERDRGHPLLDYQVTTMLWAGLEGLVGRLAVEWITAEPEVLVSKRLQDIKVRVSGGDFCMLTEEERIYYLITEAARRDGAPFKGGVKKFEKVLSLFGLAPEVRLPEGARATLYELSKVRNLVVHAAGFVDLGFKRACPSFTTPLGEQLVLDPIRAMRYSLATGMYICALAREVVAKMPQAPDSSKN